jgi:microcystin-dependent protein
LFSQDSRFGIPQFASVYGGNMGEPFVGEIRMFGGNFAPAGWAFCSGQLMPISENDTLFNLIGTTYGGDGQETFGIPDLQGRVPIHQGPGFTIGQKAGEENVTLTVQQIPSHPHVPTCQSTNAPTSGAGGGLWAATTTQQIYSTTAPATQMNAGAVASAGGSQPHDNMMSYLVVSFIISLFGVFPSQN